MYSVVDTDAVQRCNYSAASDQRWHICRHDGMEEHIDVQGQTRHIDDGGSDVLHVERRLLLQTAVRLRDAGTISHLRTHIRRRIA